MNYTLISALQHISSTKKDKAVCITSEDWMKEILFFAMQEFIYKDVVWKRTTPKALMKDRSSLDLFGSSTVCGTFVESDQLDEEMMKYIHQNHKGPLLWISSKQSLKDDSIYILTAPKPWERLGHAENAMEFFLQSMKVPIVPKACLLLAQKALSSPSSLHQEIKKYEVYASHGEVKEDELEALIEGDSTSSLWSLLDAFILKKKEPFFQELQRVEKENHPLQIIRFLRTQFEKLLVLSEGESTAKFKSQERQISSLRERSQKEKSKILQRLLLHDIGLRDGTVDEKLSLVSFFLPFFGNI